VLCLLTAFTRTGALLRGCAIWGVFSLKLRLRQQCVCFAVVFLPFTLTLKGIGDLVGAIFLRERGAVGCDLICLGLAI